MKLKALLEDQEHNLTLHESDGSLHIEIDGRSYNLKLNQSDGSTLLLHQNRVFDCHVGLDPKSRNHFDVLVKGRRYSVEILDPRRLRTDENLDRHHHGPIQIAAQMPGKVVRVLVEAGAKVDKGEGLVIVEAMKMQNELKSPREGVVLSVAVEAGNTVNAGEILITLGDSSDE